MQSDYIKLSLLDKIIISSILLTTLIKVVFCLRFRNVSIQENYLVDAPFDTSLFLEKIGAYLPQLDERDHWIRSGGRISDKYKDIISSYRLLGSYCPAGRARAEALLIKPQPLLTLGETEPPVLKFIRDYQTENRVDLIFTALLSAADETWRFILTSDNAKTAVPLPSDLISYMVDNTLKKYLKKHCVLSDAALNGYFSSNCLLYDDTAIKEKAPQIDEALANIEICDISSGDGTLLGAVGGKIASIRDDMSKYIDTPKKRSKAGFLARFAFSSLHATDLDAGALELLKLYANKRYGEPIPREHAVYGSVLTEELFNGKKFDLIISNPPHMRHEEFSAVKDAFSCYRVFHKNADLYCYYIERALSMLKEGGCAGIITSNRWMRSEYGAPLRAFLSQNNVADILDYGNIPAAKEIAMPLSAVTIINGGRTRDGIRITAVEDKNFDNIAELTENNSYRLKPEILGEKPWIFEEDSSAAIMHKMSLAGIPLGKYAGGRVYRGVLTGLNEAFAIDEATAEELKQLDAGSAELLRPFAGGRNIKRYAKPLIKKYLIFIPRGLTDKKRGETAPWEWLSSSYPAVAGYLKQFEKEAAARRDKGDYWWELRSCKYYDAFEHCKIISRTIVKRISATIDEGGIFSNDKTTIIGAEDYYLLGLLNSRLMDFYARRTSTALLNDHYELKPVSLAALPVKKISETNHFQTALRDIITENAKKLLALKEMKEEERADESAKAERAVNKAVYRLYKLTPKEISIVENN